MCGIISYTLCWWEGMGSLVIWGRVTWQNQSSYIHDFSCFLFLVTSSWHTGIQLKYCSNQHYIQHTHLCMLVKKSGMLRNLEISEYCIVTQIVWYICRITPWQFKRVLRNTTICPCGLMYLMFPSSLLLYLLSECYSYCSVFRPRFLCFDSSFLWKEHVCALSDHIWLGTTFDSQDAGFDKDVKSSVPGLWLFILWCDIICCPCIMLSIISPWLSKRGDNWR